MITIVIISDVSNLDNPVGGGSVTEYEQYLIDKKII